MERLGLLVAGAISEESRSRLSSVHGTLGKRRLRPSNRAFRSSTILKTVGCYARAVPSERGHTRSCIGWSKQAFGQAPGIFKYLVFFSLDVIEPG